MIKWIMLEQAVGFVEWDPAKAAANLSKHGQSFETAATVLLDPLALTNPDEEHSDIEERWITIGRATNGELIVVVHTWEEIDASAARIRIISARRATRTEASVYEAPQ
jgi:uncharacterized DUF497 family protein